MPITIDDNVAAYWAGAPTRAEIQKVFEDYTAATVQMQERALKMDFAIAFLMEKFGVKPEEVQAFMSAKLAEFQKRKGSANPEH